jgi:very-short-patch-repair endonuclease
MEIDLLCESFKVAVEVDGAQHLGDPAAYRRDRMKDILLQEQGYRVLRFLAEDVVQRLDRVLDTVLRVIARRKIASATLLTMEL